jgi:hypothetical protein
MARSRLAEVLAEVFPSIAKRSAGTADCWVAQLLQHDHPRDSAGISRAIETVDRYDELSALELRLTREHPVDRPHQGQYDERVLDCLTEACAFAWADMRQLGCPAFCWAAGAPDIHTPTHWIEAKAIHRSKEAKELSQRMPRNEVVTYGCREPGIRLIGKFDSAFEDAKRKFERQQGGNRVVFFNFTWLDEFSWHSGDQVLDELKDWAKSKAIREPTIDVVMCYAYNWERPFWDCCGHV